MYSIVMLKRAPSHALDARDLALHGSLSTIGMSTDH